MGVCECVRRMQSYLCTWHNREEVKGRGSLGPIRIHGDRCCGVLDKHRGCDDGWLWGVYVAAETVSTVYEFQVQHLCLKLADGAQLRPPRHAIGSSPHVALQRLEEMKRQSNTVREGGRTRMGGVAWGDWAGQLDSALLTGCPTLAANTELLLKAQKQAEMILSICSITWQCLPVTSQRETSLCSGNQFNSWF